MSGVYLGLLVRGDREVAWKGYTRQSVRFHQTSGIRARNAHKVAINVPGRTSTRRRIVGFALYDSPANGHALYTWEHPIGLRGGDTLTFPRHSLSVLDA